MIFAKLYLNDFAADTAGLPSPMLGVYVRMLVAYYRSMRALTDDRQALYIDVAAITQEDRAAVDFLLTRYFTKGDDGLWHSKRCDEEIEQFCNADGGKAQRLKGQRERRAKHNRNKKGMIEELNRNGIGTRWNVCIRSIQAGIDLMNQILSEKGTLEERDRNAIGTTINQKLEARSQNKKSKKEIPDALASGAPASPKTKTQYSETFLRFFAGYPNTAGKLPASKAFAKLSEADQQLAIAALPAHCALDQWKRDGGNFVPHAATWLRQERFRDDGASVKPVIDTRPAWCVNAGFANIYEANNARCFEHNADQFSDGKRTAAA